MASTLAGRWGRVSRTDSHRQRWCRLWAPGPCSAHVGSVQHGGVPIAHSCPGLQVSAQLSQLGWPWPVGSPEGGVPKPLICTQRCELGAWLSGVDKHLSGVSFQLFSIQPQHFQALSSLDISRLYLHFPFPHQQLLHESGHEQV